MKDMVCKSQNEYRMSSFEVNLLKQMSQSRPGQDALHVPQYLAHQVDQQSNGQWRMRLAMSRVPGLPVQGFLEKPQLPVDGPKAIARGAHLARALLKQIAPALNRLSQVAFHRDVNARNILISDGATQGDLDPRGAWEKPQFYLIDFGLAVDSRSWQDKWMTNDVGGDCRYWGPSVWFQSLYGPNAMLQRKDLVNGYVRRLDIFCLGVCALELLCVPALSCTDRGVASLRGSWQRLLDAWKRYRADVTRWNLQIFQVFIAGGDIRPVYQQLVQQHAVEQVSAHVSKVRSCLRACIDRTQDATIKVLLEVIGKLLDESSSFSLSEAVRALDGAAVAAKAVAKTETKDTKQKALGGA